MVLFLPSVRADGTMHQSLTASGNYRDEKQGDPVGHLGPAPLRVVVAVLAGAILFQTQILGAGAVPDEEKHQTFSRGSLT